MKKEDLEQFVEGLIEELELEEGLVEVRISIEDKREQSCEEPCQESCEESCEQPHRLDKYRDSSGYEEDLELSNECVCPLLDNLQTGLEDLKESFAYSDTLEDFLESLEDSEKKILISLLM